MALKPTIYKFKITLSDVDKGHYNDVNLTIARHPSENQERMMARMLAFCMNDSDGLSFTKGLSTVEEPDIWEKTADGRVKLWIEIGEPSTERIKKAARLADIVHVYPFNYRSEDWYARQSSKLKKLPVFITQFDWKGIQALAKMTARTMALSVTLSDGVSYVSADKAACEVPWTILQV